MSNKTEKTQVLILERAGLTLAKAEVLFQPFVRLEPESNYSGTGVGLSTVKRIIEKHNGEIWAESAPSDGTTFFFTLQ